MYRSANVGFPRGSAHDVAHRLKLAPRTARPRARAPHLKQGVKAQKYAAGLCAGAQGLRLFIRTMKRPALIGRKRAIFFLAAKGV